MSWSINKRDVASREDLKGDFRADPQTEHIPASIQKLIEDAIDEIPSLPDNPGTRFNLVTYGTITPKDGVGASSFSIAVGNSYDPTTAQAPATAPAAA